jgi:alpha-L-rhamnosidase
MPLAFLRAAEVTNLRCEYLKDPLGIDVMKPRLSWKLETGNWKLERGIKQTSYQILVASSENILNKDQGDLWDSGKVESDQSIHVEYQGKPLESRMRCWWKVMVWTARTEVGGPSFALRATAGRQGSGFRILGPES